MVSLRRLVYAPTERQLQAQIVDGLGRLGYVVIETGWPQCQVQCPQCGHWATPRQGTMNTPGCPDLYVSRPGWRTWVGLELKTPELHTTFGNAPAGRLRKAQKPFVTGGYVTVIHSLEEALAAIKEHCR